MERVSKFAPERNFLDRQEEITDACVRHAIHDTGDMFDRAGVFPQRGAGTRPCFIAECAGIERKSLDTVPEGNEGSLRILSGTFMNKNQCETLTLRSPVLE